MKKRISPTTSGFTLLEVLLASAILSLASFTLLWAISQSQETLTRSASRREAAILAENFLDEYKLGLAEAGAVPGHPAWSWRGEEKETPLGTELTVTVTWPAGRYTLSVLGGKR